MKKAAILVQIFDLLYVDDSQLTVNADLRQLIEKYLKKGTVELFILIARPGEQDEQPIPGTGGELHTIPTDEVLKFLNQMLRFSYNISLDLTSNGSFVPFEQRWRDYDTKTLLHYLEEAPLLRKVFKLPTIRLKSLQIEQDAFTKIYREIELSIQHPKKSLAIFIDSEISTCHFRTRLFGSPIINSAITATLNRLHHLSTSYRTGFKVLTSSDSYLNTLVENVEIERTRFIKTASFKHSATDTLAEKIKHINKLIEKHKLKGTVIIVFDTKSETSDLEAQNIITNWKKKLRCLLKVIPVSQEMLDENAKMRLDAYTSVTSPVGMRRHFLLPPPARVEDPEDTITSSNPKPF